ncbi:hypothetical protein BMR07_17090 [Methylococcaceae bacterium CS1]|nr:hypothetical protein BMR07_17090 [Methylococcaceae bacterium CS1]
MKENNEIKEELDKSPKRVDTKWRSLAKAGMVAPIMMTLANRPAWGANVRCTISGFNSVEFAGGSGDLGDSSSCGYKSIAEIYSGLSNNPAVTSVLGANDLGGGVKVKDVLSGDKGDAFDKYMIAAHFQDECPFGKISVIEVYLGIKSTGTFDFGNCELNEGEVLAFLQKMIPPGGEITRLAPTRGPNSD